MSAELESMELPRCAGLQNYPASAQFHWLFPKNQYFPLLGELDLPQQTSLCCFVNIILLLKIRGQILLPISTISETHRFPPECHYFFETDACFRLLQTCQRIGFSCYFSHPIFSFLAATPSVKLLAKSMGNLLKISCFLLKAATPFLPAAPFPSQLEKAFLRRITHRDVFKMNVGDVVVGAALPGVVEPEGQGTRVPAIQGSEFAEGAVLDVDWSIVELNPSNGKIPKTHLEETGRLGHDTST